MSIADTLDARMRAQLRSRYRPLPPAPVLIGEPVLAPPPPMAAKVNPFERGTIVSSKPPSDHPRVAKKNPFAEIVRRDGSMLYEMAYPCASESAPTLELSVREIIKIVCAVLSMDQAQVLEPRRGRDVARPRQVIMYIAKKFTVNSSPAIGRAMAKDHTTILAGIARIKQLLAAKDEWTVRAVAAAQTEIMLQHGEKTLV